MVSNGQLERGREITIANRDVVKSVTVSFDAPTADVNDLTRGKGTFEKAVQAVIDYNQNGIHSIPFYVLHDGNLHLIREAYELAKRINVTAFRFTTLHPVQRASNAELTASIEKLQAAVAQLSELNKEYKMDGSCNSKTITPDIGPTWNCSVLGDSINEMVMLPNGQVSVCCDTYDLDFDYTTFNSECHVKEEHEHFNEIIGDFSKESLANIVARRAVHVAGLKARREVDAYTGKLVGTRQFMCENCKFYHFHNVTDKQGKTVIPIKILRSK
jgi:MoaA/NifB/PqqE/SkfB family radical SAM enzyme